jgi:signal transduction histidine kinase
MMQHKNNELSDLTEFINIASHEMRTPVQSILTHAEFLYNRPEKYTKEYAQTIFRNAMRLQTLCNNLLDVNRIERQTFKLKKEKFNLTELISFVIQDFKSSIENSLYDIKNIKLLFESVGDVIVEADKDRISQVVTNLVDNAFKFTDVGSIKITLEKKDEEAAVITVRDTGSGIDPHVISDLFSKFMTISVKGTGLGLFVSKNIIDAHGGNMWAKSNTDGKGASFTFVIPLIQENVKIV